VTPFLIEYTDFKDDVKRLARKYRRIEEDLQQLYRNLINSPTQGLPIPGGERKFWKIRMGSSDMQRGRSGGFRIIYFFDEKRPEKLYLLRIFPKSEQEDLTPTEFIELTRQFLKIFQRK
jgi:mRNA-degrading endonuclease RelE of RelBE toxin-antitoxin system